MSGIGSEGGIPFLSSSLQQQKSCFLAAGVFSQCILNSFLAAKNSQSAIFCNTLSLYLYSASLQFAAVSAANSCDVNSFLLFCAVLVTWIHSFARFTSNYGLLLPMQRWRLKSWDFLPCEEQLCSGSGEYLQVRESQEYISASQLVAT